MATKNSEANKRPVNRRFTGARGWSARLKELKALQNETRLQKCDEMLTKAGVPEWVINSDSDGVPGNSTPCRLKWYLARRKDVKPGEIDQRLQRDMNKWMTCVKRHSNYGTQRPRN